MSFLFGDLFYYFQTHFPFFIPSDYRYFYFSLLRQHFRPCNFSRPGIYHCQLTKLMSYINLTNSEIESILKINYEIYTNIKLKVLMGLAYFICNKFVVLLKMNL